jgi:hypothetical protein
MAPLPPTFTRADLPDLRLTSAALWRLLTEGSVVQASRGVYVPAEHAADPVVRARALARVLPRGAAVSRVGAAWIHGVDCRAPGQLTDPLPLDCVVATGREPPSPRGVSGHVDRLPDGDVVHVDGVPVTSPERTAVDLARFLPTFMGLAAVDALARGHRLDPAVLRRRIEEWPGQRYVVRARRVLALCEPETESFGESWLRLRIVDAGFPRPEIQIWIVDGDGVGCYRLDMGWTDRCVAVEYDGEEFHSSPQQLARDVSRRQRLAEEHGWHVVGVGKGKVLGRRLTLEQGIGELLGMEPQIRRRPW